jgi:hypothetical protein
MTYLVEVSRRTDKNFRQIRLIWLRGARHSQSTRGPETKVLITIIKTALEKLIKNPI